MRGFAAIFVVFHHILGRFDNLLDPTYKIGILKHLEPPGHLSVLIFFLLSGYVIGVSQPQALDAAEIKLYIKKRFVRLYPIYIVSIILTVLVARTSYSFNTIVSHLAFTQIMTSEVLNENTALWSLHYEVLFYLLFIPVSYFRINLLLVAICCTILGLINSFYTTYLNTPALTSYMFGFTFWIFGVIAARKFKNETQKVNYTLMISSVLLVLAIGNNVYNVSIRGLDKINTLTGGRICLPGTVNWYKQAISFLDFSLLPYCIFVIATFTGTLFRGRKVLLTFFILLPLLAIFHIAKSAMAFEHYLFPSICYMLSLILYFSKSGMLEISCRKAVRIGKSIGALSYSIYIVHLPLLFIFSMVPAFSGTITTFLFRLILFGVILFIAALFLENTFQFKVRRLFFPKRTISVVK